MKIAGIILLVLQVVSFIPSLAAGESIFGYGFANAFGRCLLGIVGIILIIIANRKKRS